MFKLNDLHFYVDHINKMLFKTKDDWLYKKYLQYLKQKQIKEGKDGSDEFKNVFQRMKADEA